MNHGRMIFAQLMDHFPKYELDKLVDQYRADYHVRQFSCRDQFLAMAFAQLTCRESLRDIEACLRALHRQALPCRLSRPGLAQHAGRRQRARDLAHLGRPGAAADRHGPPALRRRGLRRGAGADGLRPGRHDHRPVPVAVSLGLLSHDQGRHQAAHPAGSAGQYPHFGAHHRRRGARREPDGPALHRGRGDLHRRSRLPGFRPALAHQISARRSSSRAPRATPGPARVASRPVDKTHGPGLRSGRRA